MSRYNDYIDAILNEEATEILAKDYMDKMKETIKKHFPNSYVLVTDKGMLGGGSIFTAFAFGKDRSEWANGYIENDAGWMHIWLHDCFDKEGKMKPMIEIESKLGGKISTKDRERIKIGWRNKKGTPDQILSHIDKYFIKLKETVIANKDKMAEIVKSKV